MDDTIYMSNLTTAFRSKKDSPVLQSQPKRNTTTYQSFDQGELNMTNLFDLDPKLNNSKAVGSMESKLLNEKRNKKI